MPNGPPPSCRRSLRPLRWSSPVDIQVYLTPDQNQAFGWHYDLEEVFIIQV
jgi:ribosomal protein L16 Arg81 hydroxylase